MRDMLSAAGVLIIGIALLVGVGVFLSTTPRAETIGYDANGCARDQRPVSTTALLVDFTDKATAANLSQLTKTFSDLRRQTPKDGKALVALLDVSAESNVTLILDVCNPGTRDGNYTDRPGPSKQDQRWIQRYYRPFEKALTDAEASPMSADSSPIFEAVTALSQRADFDGMIQSRKLIIVSDGLQLTPKVFSTFKGGDLWKAYQKSDLVTLTQADLTGVDVQFVYLLRPEFAQRQTASHRAFLRKWFESRGAKSFVLRGIRNEEEG